MDKELTPRETSVGYIFSLPEDQCSALLEYLNDIGVESDRYYFTTLPLKDLSYYSVMTFTGSRELDMLIVLKYGQYIADKTTTGDQYGYFKYHINGHIRFI